MRDDTDGWVKDTFKEFNPRNRPTEGMYRMRCFYTENHSLDDGKESMFISTEENWVHCFSCGAHGSFLNAATAKMGVDFTEALEHINFDYVVDSGKPKRAEYVSSAKEIKSINPSEYYLGRGVPKNTLLKFEVFEELDKGQKYTSVPLFDGEKEFMGYYRRYYKPRRDLMPPDFPKDSYLYNLQEAESSFIVEGFLDCWTLDGYGHVSEALLGTSFSAEQAKLLLDKGRTSIVLALDNDGPGIRAAEVIYWTMTEFIDVKFIPYHGKDPGDCTEEDWLDALENIADYADYSTYMWREYEDYDKIVKNAKYKSGDIIKRLNSL